MSNSNKVETTERGFEIVKFKDAYDLDCSLQQSSIADYDAVWLGVADCQPEITARDAIRLGYPSFGRSVGWVPFQMPAEVDIKTRMHLNKKQVEMLIQHLQKWLATGHL